MLSEIFFFKFQRFSPYLCHQDYIYLFVYLFVRLFTYYLSIYLFVC